MGGDENEILKCFACHTPTIQKLVLGETVYPLCNRCLLEHVTNNQKAIEVKKVNLEKEADMLKGEFVQDFSDRLNIIFKKYQ